MLAPRMFRQYPRVSKPSRAPLRFDAQPHALPASTSARAGRKTAGVMWISLTTKRTMPSPASTFTTRDRLHTAQIMSTTDTAKISGAHCVTS